MNRRLLIATSVVLLHVGVLWALQSGLMRRAVEVIIPGEILSEFISPPAPAAQTAQTPPPPRKPAPLPPKPQAQPVAPAPQPVIATEPSPVVAQATPAATAPAAIEASTVAATPAAPQAPARIELPSSDAAYLNNPKPGYPPLSRRLGEQGKVMVRVLIGIDGKVQQAQISKSSGYERLDQTAIATVRTWRFVPGKRAGLPEEMWHIVPVHFVLE